MQGFLNLEAFTLAPSRSLVARLPLDQVSFPDLRALTLIRVKTTETQLLRTIEKAKLLCRLRLTDVTLTTGTWLSLHFKLREMQRELSLCLSGIIDGLEPTCGFYFFEQDYYLTF